MKLTTPPGKDDFYSKHADDLKVAMHQVESIFNQAPRDQRVKTIHAFIDNLQSKVGMDAAIQCGKQECSFCCHSAIFIGPLEAEYIKKNATYTIDKERQQKQRDVEDYKDLSFADKKAKNTAN